MHDMYELAQQAGLRPWTPKPSPSELAGGPPLVNPDDYPRFYLPERQIKDFIAEHCRVIADGYIGTPDRWLTPSPFGNKAYIDRNGLHGVAFTQIDFTVHLFEDIIRSQLTKLRDQKG